MNNFIQSIIDEIKRHFSSSKIQTTKKWSYLIPLIVVCLLGIIGEYVLLLPIHYQSQTFIFHLIFLIVIFVILHAILLGTFDKTSKYLMFVVVALFVYIGVGSVYSLPIFHAKTYQNQMIDYVSQFEVDESYEQINYQDTPYRVTPLEYSDLIKWITNRKEGLPAYVKVNMVSQESEVVELKEGMKYSKSEHFGRNINRHLRMNYPTKMFEELAFEINDEGIPYWIAPVFEYKIGPFGGKDIVGAVLVNAVDGKHKYYDIKDIPNWVDRVYPAELVIQQLENYGKYTHGYINSVFSQKGVLQSTDGYNYIVIDDDVYLYTGLTSVSKDASNVGFALINLRTKEGKYYHISGAEEYSAMSSAEGKVQNLKYKATFPILVNAGGEPTYFLSLKDSSNLVKMYAFVSVKNYQIVATGSSVSEAEKAYYEVLSQNGKSHEEFEENTLTGKISSINSAVKEGNSVYYFKLEGDDHIYIADLSLSNSLPLVQAGDEVEIQFISNEHQSVVISQFKAK